ncbi:MAG: hypothetical protein JRN58_06870 [Nitrososphaerota archaeon]|nr:hypothetical protein [Nitrososphaerota archaeon]
MVTVGRAEVVIEATRRFEVAVDEKTARSMRAAVGKEVAVLCIDGKKAKWRLLKVSPKKAGVSEM